MLIPVIKNNKLLIPNTCKLAFILQKIKIKARIVLQNPARKKKYNSGTRSIVAPFFMRTKIKIACKINGSFLCDSSETIIESILPSDRNK